MMQSQRRLTRASVLGLAAALMLGGCASNFDSDTSPGDSGEGPFKIGAVLDITGAGATLGVPQQNTLTMLADQLAAEGGVDGREVELIIRDNQSSEDTAARETTKLIEQDNVDLLIGSSRTGPSLAMRPIAEQNTVPTISLAANAAIVEGSDWLFKTAQNDIVVLEALLDDAEANGYKTLALVRDASAFGEGIADFITELGESRGITLVDQESFEPDATDFTAQMTNIRSSAADAVVIWGINPAAGLAQKSYVQLDVGKPVYQSHGVANASFFEQAGDSANGVLVPQGRLLVADQIPQDDPQKEIIETYVSEYEAEFGESPNAFGGYAFDAWNIAIAALGEVGTEPTALRDEIMSVTDYRGVSGVFSFSPDNRSGLGADSIIITEAVDGVWKLKG